MIAIEGRRQPRHAVADARQVAGSSPHIDPRRSATDSGPDAPHGRNSALPFALFWFVLPAAVLVVTAFLRVGR